MWKEVYILIVFSGILALIAICVIALVWWLILDEPDPDPRIKLQLDNIHESEIRILQIERIRDIKQLALTTQTKELT